MPMPASLYGGWVALTHDIPWGCRTANVPFSFHRLAILPRSGCDIHCNTAGDSSPSRPKRSVEWHMDQCYE